MAQDEHEVGVTRRPFEVIVPPDADERVGAGSADQGVGSAGAADQLDRGRQVRRGLDDVGCSPGVIDDAVAGANGPEVVPLAVSVTSPAACRIENDCVIRGRWADDDLSPACPVAPSWSVTTTVAVNTPPLIETNESGLAGSRSVRRTARGESPLVGELVSRSRRLGRDRDQRDERAGCRKRKALDLTTGATSTAVTAGGATSPRRGCCSRPSRRSATCRRASCRECCRTGVRSRMPDRPGAEPGSSLGEGSPHWMVTVCETTGSGSTIVPESAVVPPTLTVDWLRVSPAIVGTC